MSIKSDIGISIVKHRNFTQSTPRRKGSEMFSPHWPANHHLVRDAVEYEYLPTRFICSVPLLPPRVRGHGLAPFRPPFAAGGLALGCTASEGGGDDFFSSNFNFDTHVNCDSTLNTVSESPFIQSYQIHLHNERRF